MRKAKFKIGDFIEYHGSIYKINRIVVCYPYYRIYDVEFMSGNEADKICAIMGQEEFMTKVSYSRRPLHTPDNAGNAKDKELSEKDRRLKDFIHLVLKYHAENMSADFHTESEEEFIFKSIKKELGT